MPATLYQTAPAPVKGGRGRTRRNPLARGVEERMEEKSCEAAERWEATRLGTLTTNGTHWAIARMNEIDHLGALDRVDGVGYIYHGSVGEGAAREPMGAQITEYEGDVCIHFWPLGDGRARRLLVTTRGEALIAVWTKTGPKAIAHGGKYFKSWLRLVRARVTCDADGTGGRALNPIPDTEAHHV